MKLLLCGLLLVCCSAQAAIRVVDDSGQALELQQPAERIISLAPHITEMLFAAGAGAKIVGRDAYSDFPAVARNITAIGGAAGLDRERILALQPDLIVAWGSGNAPGDIQSLRKLGLPVFVSEIRSLDEISTQLLTFGRLAGTEAPAQQKSKQLQKRFDKLAKAGSHSAPLRVFYQITAQPLFTVNGEHLISRMIERCGGENVFADQRILAPNVSLEAVLAADPDVILYGRSSADDDRRIHSLWAPWPQLPAVPESIFAIDADRIHRPGPRLIEGAEQICAHLQQARAALSE